MWAGITGTTSRPVGGKFAVACYDGDRLCGVAICGRPVARYLDDGLTLEILRCCTDGTGNACSKLYSSASMSHTITNDIRQKFFRCETPGF